MMITLSKAHKGSYWWEKRGDEVDIDPESVESVEQILDRTPGGSTSNAYVLITMKSGVQHKVYENLDEVRKALVGL